MQLYYCIMDGCDHLYFRFLSAHSTLCGRSDGVIGRKPTHQRTRLALRPNEVGLADNAKATTNPKKSKFNFFSTPRTSSSRRRLVPHNRFQRRSLLIGQIAKNGNLHIPQKLARKILKHFKHIYRFQWVC